MCLRKVFSWSVWQEFWFRNLWPHNEAEHMQDTQNSCELIFFYTVYLPVSVSVRSCSSRGWLPSIWSWLVVMRTFVTTGAELSFKADHLSGYLFPFGLWKVWLQCSCLTCPVCSHLLWCARQGRRKRQSCSESCATARARWRWTEPGCSLPCPETGRATPESLEGEMF